MSRPSSPADAERVSARVVLVDERERILLVRLLDDGTIAVDGWTPDATYWVTVGGGVEPGESIEEAARREVFEETGITDFTLGPHLVERRLPMVIRGRPTVSVEQYYAGWVDAAAVSLHHLDPLERGVLVEHRWWRHDELAAPDRAAVIYPRRIASLAAAAVDARRADRSRRGR